MELVRALCLLVVLAGLLLWSPVAVSDSEDRVVVGFIPYWTINSYEPDVYLFDYIIFFDAPAQSNGSIDTSYIETYYSEIQRINSSCNGCRLLFAVTCFDPDTIDQILAYYRSSFAQNIVSIARSYGFAGVNIDFEFMRNTNSYTREDNTDYFLEVLQILKSEGLIVSFDIAGSVETVYRDSRLNQYVDFVFLMGYNYHWSTAPTTGPVSPLKSTELDVDDSLSILDNYYDQEKIVLGLPLYGYDWPASSPDPYTDTAGSGTARTYRVIRNNYYSYGVLWDNTGHVPWIRYRSNGNWSQIWFDNITSLAMKMDYVVTHGYRGFGFWALGYEDGALDEDLFWETVAGRKYSPFVGEVIARFENGSYVIEAVNLTNVEQLNIIVVFSGDPGDVNVSYEGLGESYDYRSYTINGSTLKLVFRMQGFPGNGLSGSGVLAVVDTPNTIIIEDLVIEGGNQRIVPGEETIEQVYIGSTTIINPPPPIYEPHILPLAILFTIAALLVLYIVKRLPR